MNSRPLTYLYSEEVIQPITPSHFMFNCSLFNNPGKSVSIFTTPSKDTLLKRLQFQDNIRKHYFQRWYRMYLIELCEHFKNMSKSRGCEIRDNDIVMIEDHLHPRINWKLGKVVEVFVGRDKNVDLPKFLV